MTRYTLEIGPGIGGFSHQAVLRHEDGTIETFFADERARVIAKAQNAIQTRQAAREVEREVLTLDEFGEIIRDDDPVVAGLSDLWKDEPQQDRLSDGWSRKA